MIAPNMSDEKYKKMPKFAKVIYWTAVAAMTTAFIYFWFQKF
jgi:hypothetical protein